jgi:predicted extracellular nuclease
MRRITIISLAFLVIIILAACHDAPKSTQEIGITSLPTITPTASLPDLPTLPAGASPVVISEVLGGIQGNNNHEFIELYNRSTSAIDLRGWTIWYRLPTGQEDLLVYRFTSTMVIPPLGHLLIGRAGEDFGLPVDATFDQPLNTAGGGLQLRSTDEVIQDALGWGNAPVSFQESTAAQAMPNGATLERFPGGIAGNTADSGDNAADFAINPTPTPQNSGSPLTPTPAPCLGLRLSAPTSAEPGSFYQYVLTITNQSTRALSGAVAQFPIPSELTYADSASSADPLNPLSIENHLITWVLPTLATGETQTLTITVNIPWTYFTALANNYFVQSPNCALPTYGEPVRTTIAGGVVPIGTARTLLGSDLTIEGIATFYTGGLYAGTGDVKFYLEDETGGIQVQVFEGEGSVGVGIGSRVQVRGTVGIYRGAIQIVPIVVPDDVIRFEEPAIAPIPTQVTIQEAITNRTDLPGRLIQIEGTVTRVEEFSYSYEIDLVDENGEFISLYVDKQTNINVEMVEVGQQYRMTGIIEIRDTAPLLYPRIQADLEQIYPPELLLDVAAPIFMTGNNLITYTLTAYNHTPNPLTNVVIQASVPVGTSVSEIANDGVQNGNQITWITPELPGNGANASVSFTVAVSTPMAEIILLEQTSATADEWPQPVPGPVLRTFAGSSVPVWAIQGDGFRSTYVFDQLTTVGIVTGFFSELDGFFIQEITSDDDPLTSSGLFVSIGSLDLTLLPGDQVQVSGIVRELSNQTALQVTDPEDVVIMSKGNPLPPAVELNPPDTIAQAENYYEALEGMLVQVTGPAVAVSPTSKYGEYVVVLQEHGVDRLYQGNDNGIAIMVDDGSNAVHADNSMLPYTVTTGDTLMGLIGPLAYTYSDYKIEPVATPIVQPTGLQPGATQPLAENEFSIMTWNVLDLFDIIDPNPTDPPRPSLAEYRRDLNGAAATIAAASFPTIVALQEVENIGILEDLAANELLVQYDYQPVLVEGFDSRLIDVGYLVRGDQATIVSVEQRSAPGDLFSRPPLVLHVEIHTPSGSVQLYVINNHFLSMSGGEEATEPRRLAQAEWNLTLVQEILAEDSGALIAIVGDLNSLFLSAPIQALRDGDMIPVFDTLPAEERYTYIYQGESQVLDYIIITSTLLDLLQRVEVLHLNADFPPQAPDDTSPLGESDHDPVIAVFSP